MRHRAIAILLAGIAVAGCAARQSDQSAARQSQQPPATTPQATRTRATADDPANRQAAVLADGRHPVYLKAIDPAARTITFDLIQFYQGDQATIEAAKDHQESPPPNDYYIRNVNPKLRTLPTQADATITVNNLLNTQQPIPVTFARLATLTSDRSPVFWITVGHDQVLKVSEQWVP